MDITLEDKRVTRVTSRKDPRDKSTIFSIYPQEINEYKITLFPPHYNIPAGTFEKPGSLVIGAGSWWKDVPESNQLIEIVHNSLDVAESVINDYVIGLIAYTPDSYPGLFYVPEEISAKDAKVKYVKEFAEADKKQRNWYLRLVNFADQVWSKQPNPAVISAHMRLAATSLGLDKDWLKNYAAAAMSKCPACGALRDTNFPVCASCNMIVDPEKFKSLGIQLPEKK